MAVTLLAHTIAQASGTQTSSGIDTTGASLLILSLSCNLEGVVSDSKGNTWTPLTVKSSTNTFNRIYYAKNPTVGTGHTFTTTAVNQFCTISVAAFGPVLRSSPFDQQNGTGAGAATTLATGSVTPTTTNQLVVASCATGSGAAAPTINGGFTISDAAAFVGATAQGGGLAYLVQTTIAAANPTWSAVGGNVETATIATFIANAAGLFEVF